MAGIVPSSEAEENQQVTARDIKCPPFVIGITPELKNNDSSSLQKQKQRKFAEMLQQQKQKQRKHSHQPMEQNEDETTSSRAQLPVETIPMEDFRAWLVQKKASWRKNRTSDREEKVETKEREELSRENFYSWLYQKKTLWRYYRAQAIRNDRGEKVETEERIDKSQVERLTTPRAELSRENFYSWLSQKKILWRYYRAHGIKNYREEKEETEERIDKSEVERLTTPRAELSRENFYSWLSQKKILWRYYRAHDIKNYREEKEETEERIDKNDREEKVETEERIDMSKGIIIMPPLATNNNSNKYCRPPEAFSFSMEKLQHRKQRQEKEPHPSKTNGQRRSRRNTNRILLSDQSSLQYQRLNELFFKEDEGSILVESTTATTAFPSQNSNNDENKKYKELQLESFKLKQVYESPCIYIVENFLNASDLAYLQSKVKIGQFERSFVDQVGAASDDDDFEAGIYDTQHRTSTFLSFEKQQDARISAIELKAAKLLGCWSSASIEPLQLVRYTPGQFFGVHHDMGDLQDDGSVSLPPKSHFCKRRLATIFVYLTSAEVFDGGATWFPACQDLRICPATAGSAVLFSNVALAGSKAERHCLPDPRTIHAGEPIKKGVKYGLNIWLCED